MEQTRYTSKTTQGGSKTSLDQTPGVGYSAHPQENWKRKSWEQMRDKPTLKNTKLQEESRPDTIHYPVWWLLKTEETRANYWKSSHLRCLDMRTLKAPSPERWSQPKWAHSPQFPQLTQSPSAPLHKVVTSFSDICESNFYEANSTNGEDLTTATNPGQEYKEL